MENSELLPCPFCGSTPISHKHLPDRVSCQNTSCWICKTYIAIDDWNTRTQPRVTVEELLIQFQCYVYNTPIGAEDIRLGKSYYNWGKHYLDVLQGIAGLDIKQVDRVCKEAPQQNTTSAEQVERRNALAGGAEGRHDCLQSTQPLDVCPNCGGDADNGFDRSWPDPVPYWCTKCTGEDLEGVSEAAKFSVEPKYTREELVEIMCRANADLSPVGSDALVYLSMDDCATGIQSPNWHRDLHKMHTALSALEQAGALQVKE